MGEMTDVAMLSYEEAMAELGDLTKKLEQGQIPLADALTLYDRAKRLLAHTEELLAPLMALGA